ncbi:Selenocysteine-containing peroxiredoxin PrxU [Neorhodopirellula pilleata]|uniref:Alkyl hydroperoxide reductase C n=2 Tax=Neorhodopirellula pilleata TaxID=2714738 RepID=A0A5C6AHX2_9BACT|nr:Selenocysteine-containing peroxiredoxin PrxU [Neorhodopirellula pilleata]
MNRLLSHSALVVLCGALSTTTVMAQATVARSDAKAKSVDSCIKPARGPLESGQAETATAARTVSAPMARVGKPAPNFEANAYIDGGFRPVMLSDYKGKWVVMCFYPGNFTYVCPTELAAVAARYDEIDKLGVQVISFSTDSRFSHKIWNESELSKMIPGGLPFPMLTDPAGRIGQFYGVYDDEASVDNRGRFIIDPDGVVQAIEILTPSVGRNVDELIRQLKAFQHVRATGEATPAGWKPGMPTLKPSPELVGNVWKAWQPAGVISTATAKSK